METTSHTCPLNSEQAIKLRKILEERGYEFCAKPHALFSAKNREVHVTVYAKGPKVLIQGKGTADFIRFLLEPEITGQAGFDYEEVVEPENFSPHFGIDESGKGDYFGPLVIAGTYTDATIAKRLRELGVMDSKRISSDARIRQLAVAIRNIPGLHHAVVCIGPERYNEMHASFRNLNHLLAWGHSRVIEKLHTLRPDCPRALSDQFARPQVLQQALHKTGIRIRLEQRTRAESDPAVAAASILAREKFIDWIDRCSQACGHTLPKGASAAVIAAARTFVSAMGEEALGKVAKLHFKTTGSILPGSASS